MIGVVDLVDVDWGSPSRCAEPGRFHCFSRTLARSIACPVRGRVDLWTPQIDSAL